LDSNAFETTILHKINVLTLTTVFEKLSAGLHD